LQNKPRRNDTPLPTNIAPSPPTSQNNNFESQQSDYLKTDASKRNLPQTTSPTSALAKNAQDPNNNNTANPNYNIAPESLSRPLALTMTSSATLTELQSCSVSLSR